MKRKKTITAGRVVSTYMYTVPSGRDKPHVREAKLKCSTKARIDMNRRQATKKLENSINTNFSYRDLLVTLTYNNEHLPLTYNDSKIIARKFTNKLRKKRAKDKKTLKYIYVTEHKHARLHHHFVINGSGKKLSEELKEIQEMWSRGTVEVEYLDNSGNYSDLAHYLTKENKDDKTIYSRRWNSSLNLDKPLIETKVAHDNESLTVPLGASVIEGDSFRNEWGEYVYIKYLLPKKPYKPRIKKKIE